MQILLQTMTYAFHMLLKHPNPLLPPSPKQDNLKAKARARIEVSTVLLSRRQGACSLTTSVAEPLSIPVSLLRRHAVLPTPPNSIFSFERDFSRRFEFYFFKPHLEAGAMCIKPHFLSDNLQNTISFFSCQRFHHILLFRAA
jgi:hypothetical protein